MFCLNQKNVYGFSMSNPLPDPIADFRETSCCIVGGGPGGVLLALLLARKGVDVTLLESHDDFERDFRGDTIHPSTLEALDQIGLTEGLLQLPHGKIDSMRFHSQGHSVTVADFSRLDSRFPYIMIMPQSRFLDYLAKEAKKYPNFHLVMGANVQRLVQKDGSTQGVLYRGKDGLVHEVRAPLTIGADGRFSKVRNLAGIETVRTNPPMDILWFRLAKLPTDLHDQINFHVAGGRLAFLFDRGTEWQVGYAVLKGSFGEIKATGIDALRESIVRMIPWLGHRADSLKDWHQVTVLSVESSRVKTWHQPGLLLIGDAAHVMSPVGGVGISYAIQDAIEAANVLTTLLLAGKVTDSQLARVQKLREPAVQAIQKFQGFVQERVVKSALTPNRPFQLPWIARILLALPILRNFPGRMIAFGINPARIQNP